MQISPEVIEQIRKYAIKNAVDYGEAKMENVLGKVARSVPKDQFAELKKSVEKIISEVNVLPKTELLEQYKKYEKEFEDKYEKTVETTSKPRMILEGAEKGNFATRFPPEPSGYLHIGHAKSVYLEQEFAKIYEGKLFLYFDDTNPEKESQEFVEQCKKDLAWLGVKFDKEYYASDSIDVLYDYTKKLIELGKAYACECSSEIMKAKRFAREECEHRSTGTQDNLKKFEMMISGKYEEGTIVIRYKGDMKSNNTAMHDPTLLRIKKEKHYRQGTRYLAWPTYDLNTPINDSLNGVTDVIRDKNYELRDELYFAILDSLKLRKPRIHSDARLSVKGQPKQKREIKKLIEEGKIKSFDDPRLITIVALRRRGIQPDAIRKFTLSFGMSKMNSEVDLTYLYAENRKILEANSKRIFYVPAPVDIEIKDFKTKQVTLNFHPTKDLGSRSYTVKNNFYISGADVSYLKSGEVIKLKDLFSIKISREDDSILGSISEEDADKRFQWVCDGNYVKCTVLVPEDPLDDLGKFVANSLRTNMGYVENYAVDLKEREIVQFERFGFCILDDKKTMQFIFISR